MCQIIEAVMGWIVIFRPKRFLFSCFQPIISNCFQIISNNNGISNFGLWLVYVFFSSRMVGRWVDYGHMDVDVKQEDFRLQLSNNSTKIFNLQESNPCNKRSYRCHTNVANHATDDATWLPSHKYEVNSLFLFLLRQIERLDNGLATSSVCNLFGGRFADLMARPKATICSLD